MDISAQGADRAIFAQPVVLGALLDEGITNQNLGIPS